MQNAKLRTLAIDFAARAHEGQTRKGSRTPYIVHPMEAMAIAATMTDDAEVLAAAALHDVVEDCGVSEAEIRRLFGERVAKMVMFETERKEPDAAATWQKRKLRTVNRLRAADRSGLILTLADKLSNLRAIDRDLRALGPALWQRFNQTNPSMHRWYYASICESLRELEDTAAWQEYSALIVRVFGNEIR